MGNKLSCADIQGDEESLFNILAFCDRKTRSAAVFVAARYSKIFTTEASFRWRLERLHIEHGIYSPTSPIKGQTWKSLYLELDKKRSLWLATEDNHANNNSNCVGENISVYARIKPLGSGNSGRVNRGRKAVLPLHQRLALIRIDMELESNSDALCVLKEQGGWFQDRTWDEIEVEPEGKETKDDNPTNLLTSGIKHIDADNSRVVVVDLTQGLREFEFDAVMHDSTSQQDVYATCTHRLVCDVINGISATVCVYGQTGSGKTFTMFGDEDSFAGIVPRACSQLMSALEYRRDALNLNIQCEICISYVEVYGNEILDLLKNGGRVGQSKVSSQRSVLSGSVEVQVSDVKDVTRLLAIGEEQKRKAATAMNQRSSRAHSVVIVKINQQCTDTGKSITSKLFLADLGGCEQTKKSDLAAGRSNHIDALKELEGTPQADAHEACQEAKYSTGFVKSDRMREAVNINLGLMSLKSCIEALTHKRQHVPYANSKLTMLLSSGLGGDSKTTIIVCAAQEDEHSSETINAFKFGQTCRQVSNNVRTQTDIMGDLMKELDDQIMTCEVRIQQNERWEVKEEQVVDDIAEEGTRIELRKTTVLTGAEEDRKLLCELLSKKAQLSGSSLGDQQSKKAAATFGGNIGFGKQAYEYGLGQRYLSHDEKENYRFRDKPSEDLVPGAVKSKKVQVVEAKRKGRLAYSGISA